MSEARAAERRKNVAHGGILILTPLPGLKASITCYPTACAVG
jgi:hypothetical protein